MEKNNDAMLTELPIRSFKRLFWEQQLQASQLSDLRHMRWHPVMIRWCLNLKLLSSASYHMLQTRRFMQFPSERTFHDYTHYVKASSGFQCDIDEDLKRGANLKDLPEWKRYMVILIDEMKVKERNSVWQTWNKSFVDIGDVNNPLTHLENSKCSHPTTATHMLVLMVRDIFFQMEYPYAHFSTHRLTADSLFLILWEGIEHLETQGFKVLVFTGDG